MKLALLWPTLALLAASLNAQQQRRCVRAQLPRKLPAASSLLDSAGAAAAFGTMTLPPKGIVFSAVYLDDSLPIVHVVEPASMSLDSARRPIATFKRVLVPQTPDGVWGVRVRIRQAGGGGAIAIERARYCPPEFDGPQVEFLRFRVDPNTDRLPTGGRRIRPIIEATVSELGDLLQTRVIRSSGIAELDQEIITKVQAWRFLPALLDDTPVTSWVRTDGTHMRL
jgi:TonB family protein